ncbi:MAG TPA: hypothetical protein ENN87_03025 [Phycisphaerales bacterium]|nr:hypothetical protein [Phycisphaerales bacterium]
MNGALTNIVFTRNRPLQLDAYLTSLYRFMGSALAGSVVLYKEESFAEQYETLFRERPHCRVVRESDFHDDFLAALDGVETPYVIFGTDDVVYFDSVDWSTITATFDQMGDSLFGFSLRLNPSTLQADQRHMMEMVVEGRPVYGVHWAKALDKTARYPFELNSTIYRTDLVRRIIGAVDTKSPVLGRLFRQKGPLVRALRPVASPKRFLLLSETFKNPNTLEGLCYRWCRSHARRLPPYLCFQKLCACAIQVNIVNTAIDNPIDGAAEHSVEALNAKYAEGFRFDHAFLMKNKPRRTHVGRRHFNLVQCRVHHDS